MWWLLLGICLALLLLAVYSTQQILYPDRHLVPIPTPSPVFSTHALTAYDGSPFDVWLLEAAQPRGRLLICHGYYANRYQVLGLADGLRQRGYEVLLFELRGHGGRAGPCTLGVREQRDAATVLRWASQRPQAAALPLGLIGFSMGAAVACRVAAHEATVAAVVTDSLYSRLLPVIRRGICQRYWWPLAYLARVAWWGVQVRLRTRLARWDPASLAPRLRQPLLAIQGGEDRRVPPLFGLEFYERWAGRTERWDEREAAHVGIFASDPQRYCDRVAEFLEHALA